MRESVVFYRSFYEAIKELPDEYQLEVFRAISEYSFLGEEPEMNGISKAIFSLIKPQIDANNRKYENGKRSGEKRKANRNQAESISEPSDKQNGNKQGTNHEQNGNKTEASGEQTASKSRANVNDNVNANDNVNVNDNVNDNDNDLKTYAPDAEESPSAPPVITLPLNDKSEYPVTGAQVLEWSELYPAIDVEQQLRNMRGWLLSNPEKRKTKRGICTFITRWLSKEQDRGGTKIRGETRAEPVGTYDFEALEKQAFRRVSG